MVDMSIPEPDNAPAKCWECPNWTRVPCEKCEPCKWGWCEELKEFTEEDWEC